jgi:pheromone shutdown protein TraB
LDDKPNQNEERDYYVSHNVLAFREGAVIGWTTKKGLLRQLTKFSSLGDFKAICL